ncbi:vanillate O-demethylase ferredoxin subunit [Pseudomonas sp. JAI111]|uniref:fatty acid desaturase n=1 Tax=Pseudomonas sp. JAI111 TaxID=2735913 RepID=UPI002169F60D|nr:fatty acid desaturase [Pseudomonas sp. JAI111]MCS3835754.1 vanillate O-demethylase ferredoxin subunit [Pseudomonas sp. JAI111]
MFQQTTVLDGRGVPESAFADQAREDWAMAGRLRATPQLQALHTIPLCPLPTLCLLLGCVIAFGLSSYGMLAGWMPIPLGMIINVLAMYASFTPLHDGTHRAVSRNPLINDVVSTVSGQFLFPGFEVAVYRMLHLAHHKSTGEHSDDPDEGATGSLSGFFLFGSFLELHWIYWYLKRFNQWSIAQNVRFFLGVSLMASWYFFWIASPWALEWMLIWWVPQRIALLLTLYIFAHIQHPPGVEQREHPIHATAILNNKWLDPLMLGQNAHLIHHLYPQIPWYRLNAGWRATKTELLRRSPPIRGYWGGWSQNAIRNTETPWRLATIVATEDIAQDIRLFTFESASPTPLPIYEAGAHIDVRLDPDLVRQYSLIGRPGSTGQWQIAVKRDANGRGGSVAAHARLQVGTVVEVGIPRSNFPLQISNGRHVLIAGGIGMTPLISMAYALAEAKKDFALHVFARTQAHVPFGQAIRSFPFAARIQLHCDEGKGFENNEITDTLGQYQDGDQVYLCGPAGFMERVQAAAVKFGWPANAIATENFSARGPSSPDQPFTITLARSGRQLRVDVGESIVDALERERLSVDTVCRQGVCGTCRCRVLSGDIEHRDAVLTTAEREKGNQILLCVSRATGEAPLVLDL